MTHNIVLEQDTDTRHRDGDDAIAQVTVGQKLMQARQDRGGLDLLDISRELCIRPHLLAALEQDDFNKFPSACYAAGFLKNYAAYLGLNISQVVAQYKREFNGSSKKVDLKFIEIEKSHNYSQMMTLSFIVLSLLALYGVWHAMGQNRQMTFSALPEISDVASSILASVAEKEQLGSDEKRVPEETVQTAALVEDAPTATVDIDKTPAKNSRFALMQQAQAAPVETKTNNPALATDQVRLTVREDTWVRVVSADREILVDRIILAGEEFYITDRAGMTLMTSNAGAVSLFVGGTQIDTLGKRGEIRKNISLDKDDLLMKTAQLSH